ncbi:ADP-ribosylglycohydrolase family protein [Dysgonomonas sp. Marseille-P4361]|uniref:ADP-ribosylglycohydrolase family protein n=1 Tax=Dysgonomonas sp. Marseille-P4361 TaxID=2161820 RepID=UPI000D550815|nr:ADP-ribosylglycohydrolase family protein [Dysgonomonas sp. Marseille-P4361]
MKKIAFIPVLIICLLLLSCQEERKSGNHLPEKLTMTKEQLLDKIKGGWAGQTIGVTFGGPTEFRYQGTFIKDDQPIDWRSGYVKELMIASPGLYDDIYMDLTFVDVLERVGLDAPVDSFAYAFANAEYTLWHANQAARYNILHGVKDPGHWLNNPHADDIDYQIEADYAGLMNPGMVNSASEISDKIGHIMNYGDGWYGGVYVGAMYSLAFISDDVEFIVTEALKTIPAESKFYKCMADVINWHKEYPDDWKQTWFELERKHSDDIGCSEGVFSPLNIDARINAAYIILGLLYGQGNFTKTMEISTRAGQDSDCNPSSAGGILGTMLGYNNIPEYWLRGLDGAEDIDFKYTTMSLNKVYAISNKHALDMITRNGGEINETNVTIKVQKPEAVRLEQSFEGMYPIAKKRFSNSDFKTLTFEFEGTGFVLRGDVLKRSKDMPDGSLTATMYIDGEKIERAEFPTAYRYRRLDLFWRYQLPKGKHTVMIEVEGASDKYYLRSWDYVVYSDAPITTVHPE